MQVVAARAAHRRLRRLRSDRIGLRHGSGPAAPEHVPGDEQAARVQLVEIRDRGGEDSWAYRSLLQSLDGYRKY